jgi:hypothetical protein
VGLGGGGRQGVKFGVVASRGGPGNGLAPFVLYWLRRVIVAGKEGNRHHQSEGSCSFYW